MKKLVPNDKANLLAVFEAANALEKSEIVAIRDYASHILAETRCMLDQLMIMPTDEPAG